jgi:hypothetical protein
MRPFRGPRSCATPGVNPFAPEDFQSHSGLSGAVEKTRTSTGFRPQRPQRCASTSSATTASSTRARERRPPRGRWAPLAKRLHPCKRDRPNIFARLVVLRWNVRRTALARMVNAAETICDESVRPPLAGRRGSLRPGAGRTTVTRGRGRRGAGDRARSPGCDRPPGARAGALRERRAAPSAQPARHHGAGRIPVGRAQAGFQPISAERAERGTSVTASLTDTVSPGARLRLGGCTSKL